MNPSLCDQSGFVVTFGAVESVNKFDQQNSDWLEISVVVPAEYAEPVTHLFSKHGDGRVFVVQRGDWDSDDLESSIEDETVNVFCYLRKDDTLAGRKAMIDVGVALIGELTTVGCISERDVNQSEWEQQTFPAVRVGKRTLIAPLEEIGDQNHHDVTVEQAGDVIIYLAPGLAFGTGNHPTTRMCIEQIEEEAATGHLEGQTVLDVGCGSGVLSIAALKFGALKAWCLDIDETAIRAAKRNIYMSGVEDRAIVERGTLPYAAMPPEGCDLVLANITSRVIIDLSDELVRAIAVEGVLMLSGILEGSAEDVIRTFIERGLVLCESRQQSDWMMFKFSKVR